MRVASWMRFSIIAFISGLMVGQSALAQLDPLQPRSLLPFPGQPGPVAPPRLNPAGVTITASFEPAVLRLMRFGEYRITVIGAVSGIDLPDTLPVPEGLILDLTGKAPGVTVVNGQRLMTMTFQYSVTASHAGTFVVPSYSANVGGTPVTVPAAQLVVQEPGAADLPYQAVRAVIDLTAGEYFVGQMIPARLLVLDTPDETVQAIANVTKPSGDFLFQSQNGARRENVMWEGKAATALITPLRLTPIKPGESDVSVQAIVFVNKLNAAGRPSGNTAQAMLDTPAVRVRVRPLPEAGRKPGFTGAIGKFELGKIELSTREVVVGDPVMLTVTLAGDGNLEAIGAPTIESNEVWQSFTPTMEVDRDAFSSRGSKTFKYTLIPRKAESRAVPPIPFSYFDPESKQYVDLSIPPQPISVKPDKSAAATPAPATPAAGSPVPTDAPAAATAEPILTGLSDSTGPWRWSPSPISWSGWFWAGQAVPALALLGLWLWRRRTDFLAAHPEIVRRRAARVAARRNLRLARSAAGRRDVEGFVTASIDAIRAPAAPLDTTEAQSLVLEEVLAKVPREHGADEIVRKLFERAHAKHFSGHTVPANGAVDLLPQVEKTVSIIERHQP